MSIKGGPQLKLLETENLIVEKKNSIRLQYSNVVLCIHIYTLPFVLLYNSPLKIYSVVSPVSFGVYSIGENRYTSCGFCYFSKIKEPMHKSKIFGIISKKMHLSCYCTHNLIILFIFLLVISNSKTQKISTMYPKSEGYFVQSSRIVRTPS